jgi:hypothetical protein
MPHSGLRQGMWKRFKLIRYVAMPVQPPEDQANQGAILGAIGL